MAIMVMQTISGDSDKLPCSLDEKPRFRRQVPYEILSEIISLCPPTTFFTLTQVNTTFRRIVYEQAAIWRPLMLDRSAVSEQLHPLAIHLICNQRPIMQKEKDGMVYAPVFDAKEYLDFLQNMLRVWNHAAQWEKGDILEARKRDIEKIESRRRRALWASWAWEAKSGRGRF